MDINRNQFFMFGILVVLLGLQLRLVDRYVLNEKATKFIADRANGSSGTGKSLMSFASSGAVAPRLVVRPPEWSGWCLMTIGSVLILHSFALRRPES